MSRRQALGVITSQRVNGPTASTSASINNRNTVKSSSQNNVLKTTTASATNINIENVPPPGKQQTSSKQQQQHIQVATESEFEIFQEEQHVAKVTQRKPLQNAVAAAVINVNNVNHPLQQVRTRETVVSSANFYLSNSLKEQDEEEDDEEDDDDENEEDKDEDEDPVLSQECSNDKENDDEALEEEGISRLNLAVMIDSKSDSNLSKHNQSTSELMMDSSSSTHNDSGSSPMILDDTIKFASKSTCYVDDEEEEEEAGDSDECGEEHDIDEEDDEETRRKLEIAEQDNMMMNFMEYKDDILNYMRNLECSNRPKPTYMKKQIDITSSMRSILIDWLVEVCEEYKLNLETLYLAVNFTDRFLSQMSVLRGKLQLVGTASMYIAAKYEEITPPDVNEFVYITDDTYTKKQVLRMEHLLLKVLDFRMSSPTTNWFLSHYLRFIKLNTSLNNANNADLFQRIENLSRYLAELTLIDADTYLAYMPSQIAVSAVYLALFTLGRPWTKQIADICGYAYDLSELKTCISDMFKTMQGALTHPQQAIQEKYKQSKYDYVALIEAPKALPTFIYQ